MAEQGTGIVSCRVAGSRNLEGPASGAWLLLGVALPRQACRGSATAKAARRAFEAFEPTQLSKRETNPGVESVDCSQRQLECGLRIKEL